MYTGASQKLRLSWKIIFFYIKVQKNETFIYSRFITHKVKYLKPCFNLDVDGIQLMKINDQLK